MSANVWKLEGDDRTITLAAPAGSGDYTLTLPPDDGDAGEQLQTNGAGVLTWEVAISRREVKDVLGVLDAESADALERIVSAPVYAFRYKPDAKGVGGDYKTVYHGVMAEEYPEVMHHNGRVFNPLSAFGEAALAIKELARRVAKLEALNA